MQETRSVYLKGIALVVCAATLWSLSGLLVRWIDTDELTMIFWRSAFAAVFLSLYMVLLDRRRGGILDPFVQLGLIGYLVSLCFSADTMLFIFALERTSVANVVIIFATTPLVAAILGWVFLDEPLHATTWAAIVAVITGVAWMMSGSFGSGTLIGDLLALLVAVLFAVPIVLIRRHPHVDVICAVLLSALTTSLICMPFATFESVNTTSMWLLFVFGVFEYGVALVLFSIGVKRIPVAQSSLLGLLETVLAPMWVWIFINEVPSGRTFVGGGVVLVTLVLYTLYAVYTRPAGSSPEAPGADADCPEQTR